ncbi:MAG: hypothetical protein WBN01_03005, partial [Polyangiales bacterium]
QHSDARFGARMVGQGPRWAMIEKLFSLHCDRLGLEYLAGEAAEPPRRRKPGHGPQLPLLF